MYKETVTSDKQIPLFFPLLKSRVNKENIYGPISRYHTFLIIRDLVIFHGYISMVIPKILFFIIIFQLILSSLKTSGKGRLGGSVC